MVRPPDTGKEKSSDEPAEVVREQMRDARSGLNPDSYGVSSNMRQNRFDLHILRSLRRIIRAVDIYSGKLKSKYQITGPQLVCLLAIVETGSLTITAIAKRVHVSPSTVVGILDRLEKKELIRRDRDHKDKRQVNVAATEKGVQLADYAPSPLQDGLARALNRLSNLEQATIALALRRVVDLMEAEDIEAAPILETGHLMQDESATSTPDSSKRK
jgi:DNA-binding MarR family transcriptional regulator